MLVNKTVYVVRHIPISGGISVFDDVSFETLEAAAKYFAEKSLEVYLNENMSDDNKKYWLNVLRNSVIIKRNISEQLI